MAWFALGALLLLLAAPGGGGKAERRLDRLGLVAGILFATAAWRALSVYPAGTVVPIALGWLAGLGLLHWFNPKRALPLWARGVVLALGAASSLFALFGPADGLF